MNLSPKSCIGLIGLARVKIQSYLIKNLNLWCDLTQGDKLVLNLQTVLFLCFQTLNMHPSQA